MMTSAERTAYEVDENGVALLRLERPQARNAIDTLMLNEMLGAARRGRATTRRCGCS